MPQPGIVVRARALGCAQNGADPVQSLPRDLRNRRFVQRPVNLPGPPARERPAAVRQPEAAAFQDVNRKARPPGLRTARRAHVRHVDPDLGEAPRLVERQLAHPNVRRIVHLHDHVRQVVAVHVHLRPQLFGRGRMQVEDLVRLQQLVLGAVGLETHQVRRAEGLDRRTARSADEPGQPRQPLRRSFVIGGRRFADHHRSLRARLPVLHAAVVILDFLARDADRPAAGEVGLGDGRVLDVRRLFRGEISHCLGGLGHCRILHARGRQAGRSAGSQVYTRARSDLREDDQPGDDR